MITAIITSDSPRARRGFSLAELVVVLAILAVAAAIAVPRFASAGSAFRARGAAERLADAIRDAAATARARGTTVRVRLSKAGNNYNAAVLSPLQYIEIYGLASPPFEATIERIRVGNSGSALDINGHGVYSTAIAIELKSGSAIRAVWVDPDTGVVSTGTLEEAVAFVASDAYR